MSLVFKKEKYLSAGLNEESSVPALANMGNVQMLTESVLDEDDGLFVGYGYIPSIFPYRMQDLYSRKLGEKEYLTAVLENKYLRAEFFAGFRRQALVFIRQGNRQRASLPQCGDTSVQSGGEKCVACGRYRV